MTRRRKVIGAIAIATVLIVVAGIVGAVATSRQGADMSSLLDEARDLGMPSNALDDATEEQARAPEAGGEPGQAGGGSDGEAGFIVRPAQDSDISVTAVPNSVGDPARVIKNASLEIEVDPGEFQRQFARATAVAERFGGFVSSSRVNRIEDELSSGTVTMRVPSDRFDGAVAELQEIGEIRGEERSGQDVTREFVDLEARLRQAQTEEGFFIRLLDEAESISDLIQIQSQLSNVQLRIEQLQGQINFLKDQTSLSTITAYLYEPGAEDRPVEGLAEAWQRAVDAFQTVIAGAIISLGWLAPFALLGLVVFGLWRMRRRPAAGSGSDVPRDDAQ